MKKNWTLLAVFANDRPDIIAEVTQVLFQHKANLEDITMTLLEGELVMMMMVCLAGHQKKFIQKSLDHLTLKKKFTFFWKDMPKKAPAQSRTRNTTTYLVTALGKDRTGIVHHISRVLASCRLNITDLNSRILKSGGRSLYAMALEVEIPANFDLSRLKKSLALIRKKLKLEISLKPVESLEY